MPASVIEIRLLTVVGPRHQCNEFMADLGKMGTSVVEIRRMDMVFSQNAISGDELRKWLGSAVGQLRAADERPESDG